MGKLATTVEEQIALLQSRGMIISDRDKAIEHLLDIGYYRLGFYWHYFEKDKEHNFYEGTDINDAIDLYYLDFDLRQLLSRYIYRIEVHFRTQVVYYISNKYKSNPTWFVDNDIVTGFDRDIYGKLKDKNSHIIRHHEKHPNDLYAPAWKTLEFLSFGQLIHIFKKTKDSNVKSEISKVYGVKKRSYKRKQSNRSTKKYEVEDYQCLHDYLTAILNIRNICSHSGVLFDYKQDKGIRKIPDHRFRPQSNNQTDLYSSVCLILYILNQISQNRVAELKECLEETLNKAVVKNKKLKNIIINYMGFKL